MTLAKELSYNNGAPLITEPNNNNNNNNEQTFKRERSLTYYYSEKWY